MAWALERRDRILPPAHWLVETAAVLARLSPTTVMDDVTMLRALDLRIDDGPAVLGRDCRLAIELQQHLFDTLYHAVALETPDATLVTADERYLTAGSGLGRIMPLAEWAPV